VELEWCPLGLSDESCRGKTLESLHSCGRGVCSRRTTPALSWCAERLVIYCQTTSVSAAHATHCATYCTPCRPLIRAFSGWMCRLVYCPHPKCGQALEKPDESEENYPLATCPSCEKIICVSCKVRPPPLCFFARLRQLRATAITTTSQKCELFTRRARI
jgi:hypothetical protein